MTLWRKQAVGYWLNPKIVAAGQDAGLVFQAILDVHAELGRDGVLEARAASVATIHSRLPHMSRKRVLRGLDAAVRENLVAIAQDGSTTILGWDDEWRPRKALPEIETTECTRCGASKGDDGFRFCSVCREKERVRWLRRVASAECGASAPHGSADLNGTGTLSGCSEEERREDQSRQELGLVGRKDLPLGSGAENQKASASKTARDREETAGEPQENARGVDGILAQLHEKCTRNTR